MLAEQLGKFNLAFPLIFQPFINISLQLNLVISDWMGLKILQDIYGFEILRAKYVKKQ